MNCTVRKLASVATLLGLGLGLVSCNENEKPQANAVRRSPGLLQSLQGAQVTYPNAPGSPTASATPTNPALSGPRTFTMPGADLTPVTSQQQSSSASQDAAINFPKDARWTLYCASITGPDRIARTTQLKSYLASRTPYKDWYVVHNEQESTIFHGFYPTVEKSMNPRAAAKAHADRKGIGEWKDENGDRPFQACFFTPITPPDPVAQTEYNLANAPADRYWSVQIMAFQDHPLRKQAAVDAVKDLRAKGVEAYYHHGATISSVCVGSWPRHAIKEQEVAAGQAMNEDDAVLVSNAPLPAHLKNARMRTPDGKRVVSYAQRVEIADPSLQATFQQYPEHAINYEFQMRKAKGADGKTRDVAAPSFLVVIPRAEASALSGNGLQDFNNAPANTGRAPESNLPAGAGRLRGLGN